jgi:hypothetical protein
VAEQAPAQRVLVLEALLLRAPDILAVLADFLTMREAVAGLVVIRLLAGLVVKT